MGRMKAPDHQQNQGATHPKEYQPLQKPKAQFQECTAGTEIALEDAAVLGSADGDNRRCGWCEDSLAGRKKLVGRHILQVQRLVRRRCRALLGRHKGKMAVQQWRCRKKRQEDDEGGRASQDRNLQWPLPRRWPPIF